MTSNRGRTPHVGWRFVRAVILSLVALWAFSLGMVLLWQTRDVRRTADAIVVLGAAQWDGKPSPVLRARVDHAITLWRRGLAPTLIMTGGKGQGDTTTEAAVERRYAMSLGVPSDAIRVETESRSTSESLRNVAGMLAHDAREVILVSDPFHMLRLSIVARRFGLRPQTSPTPTSPISANRSESWRYTLHESWKAPVAFFFEFTDRR
ncbi:MAG: YdcF family protein [Gemmatimonadaceae bacterium]